MTTNVKLPLALSSIAVIVTLSLAAVKGFAVLGAIGGLSLTIAPQLQIIAILAIALAAVAALYLVLAAISRASYKTNAVVSAALSPTDDKALSSVDASGTVHYTTKDNKVETEKFRIHTLSNVSVPSAPVSVIKTIVSFIGLGVAAAMVGLTISAMVALPTIAVVASGPALMAFLALACAGSLIALTSFFVDTMNAFSALFNNTSKDNIGNGNAISGKDTSLLEDYALAKDGNIEYVSNSKLIAAVAKHPGGIAGTHGTLLSESYPASKVSQTVSTKSGGEQTASVA